MNKPIGCTKCGGNDHNTDECRRFALVPVEPTPVMLDVAVSHALMVSLSGDYNWSAYMRDVWLRMVAAAASAQGQQVEFGDAYQGAREDLAIWKRRALEAEEKLRQQGSIIDHLTLEAQGETRMGEPHIAQGQQVEWRTTAVMLEQANAGLAQLNGKLRAELSALKAQQVGQEPVGYAAQDDIDWNGDIPVRRERFADYQVPLYTAPPARAKTSHARSSTMEKPDVAQQPETAVSKPLP